MEPCLGLTPIPRGAAHSDGVADDGVDRGRGGEQGSELPELRVGDAERRAAMLALDAHLEAGRLSVDEYGDRSAAAVTAVHRGDLAALFTDLPAPHPPLPRRAGDPAVPAVPVAGAVDVGGGADLVGAVRPAGHDAVVPHPGAGLALGLLIMLVFALPAIVGAAVAGAVPAGGFLLLPLLFIALGGVGRRRRRGHGHHGGHGGR